MIFYLLLNKPLKAKLNTTDNIERYCKKNRLSTFSKKIIKNVALNGGVDELLFLGVKLKKKTDFNEVSTKDVKQVEKMINYRPVRKFDYKTPNEVYLLKSRVALIARTQLFINNKFL